jgi:hypothetical protein
MAQACEFESVDLSGIDLYWMAQAGKFGSVDVCGVGLYWMAQAYESSLQFEMRIFFWAFLNFNLEEMYWSLEENICWKKMWYMKHFGWKAAIPPGAQDYLNIQVIIFSCRHRIKDYGLISVFF